MSQSLSGKQNESILYSDCHHCPTNSITHWVPPFLWKLPLSCFKHYSDALFVHLCVNDLLTVYARKGGGKWKCVVLFYYVAGQGAFACVCVCMWTELHCSCVTAFVYEVGAAECHHKLVGHSSAANQRSKWLWVSAHQANLWLWY